jgi:hypothetical protein
MERPAGNGLRVALNPDTIVGTWLHLARGEKSAA